jgi:hypothetical protein
MPVIDVCYERRALMVPAAARDKSGAMLTVSFDRSGSIVRFLRSTLLRYRPLADGIMSDKNNACSSVTLSGTLIGPTAASIS